MRARLLAAALVFLVAPLLVAAPAFDTILPEDTIAYAAVKSVPALKEKFKTHPVRDIWMEPSVQKFFEKAVARLEQEVQKAEGKAGVTLAEAFGLFSGQVALAISADDQVADVEVLALAEVGDKGERAKQIIATLIAAAAKSAKAEGADAPAAPAVKTVDLTIEGVKFVGLLDDDDAPDNPSAAYGVVNGVLIFGRPVAAIKRTVIFLKNAPPASLATTAAYKASQAAVNPAAEAHGYLNIARILRIVNMKARPDVAQNIQALGLGTLVSLGFGVELGKEADTTRIFLQVAGTPAGLVKILLPTPGPLHTGAAVPADSASMASVRFQPAVIWDEVEKMLNAMAPPILAAINGKVNQAAQASGQPISLRNDIFAAFGPRIAFYSRFEKPYNLEDSQQFVVTLDIASKQAFQNAYDKLLKIAPELAMLLQPKDYMGYQVYSVATPNRGGAPDAKPAPAFAVTEKELVFSTRGDLVEAHLRRAAVGGAALLDKAEFQDGLKALPSEGRVALTFSDPRPQTEFFLTALREGQFAMFAAMAAQKPAIAEFLSLFDLQLLPPTEDINRHLSATTAVAQVRQDGMLITSRMPLKRVPPAAAK
jgi:hypothetical protein